MRADRGTGKTARAIQLWNQGLNTNQIGLRLGSSAQAISTLLTVAGIKRNKLAPRRDYSPTPGAGRTFTHKFRFGAE